MRIAILHFHLRAGGVTRVIELACAALASQGCDVLVLSGEPAPPGCRLPDHQVRVVPLLRYGVEAREADVLREDVEEAMRAHWGSPAGVIHAHNHALGKNFALTLAVSQWAKEGRALLLQLHDFAENGRPLNYAKLLAELGGQAGLDDCLYPMAPRVGYAVLNRADRSLLLAAGMTASCELLSNPALLPPGGSVIPTDELGAERAIVYSTRAIRRKNVGEALLWSLGLAPGEKVIITGSPESGPDVAIHAEWLAFSESLGLPVLFDAQRRLGRTTVDFLLSADLCLTTSVTEGFGMAYLEPWLADCPVVGRDLRSVTDDFRDTGLIFEDLYERIDVPLGAIGEEEIVGDIERQIRATCAAYRVEYEDRFLEQARGSVFKDGLVDFGRITEERQRTLLGSLRASGRAFPLPHSREYLVANRLAVEREYSLESYGIRLADLYRKALTPRPAEVAYLDTRRMLLGCLSFEDFSALRG